jgi:hypothetical protein
VIAAPIEMGLVLNLLVQTIVWFGFMGAIIFSAAGTIDYLGGWLYLGGMVAMSVVLGLHGARVDPGLLKEQLKLPMQKDRPLADNLVLIPFLILMFGGMGISDQWRRMLRAGIGH